MYHDEVCDQFPGLQNFPGNALSHRSECHHAFSLHPVAIIITEKKFFQEQNGCWAEDMLLEEINFSWQTALQKGVPIYIPMTCVRTSIFPHLCFFGTFHFVKLFILSNMMGEKDESFLLYLIGLITNEVGRASVCAEVGALSLVR